MPASSAFLAVSSTVQAASPIREEPALIYKLFNIFSVMICLVNEDYYLVMVDCTQCNSSGPVRVDKGRMREAALEQQCPTCGVKGYLSLREEEVR